MVQVQTGLEPTLIKNSLKHILDFSIPKGYVFTYPKGIHINCNTLNHRCLTGWFEYRWDHQQKPLIPYKTRV